MSKLSEARDLLNSIGASVMTRDAMEKRLTALLSKVAVMDLEDDPVSLDEKALDDFEKAVCYEIQTRREKMGRNINDDLLNAIKRIRRKVDDE